MPRTLLSRLARACRALAAVALVAAAPGGAAQQSAQVSMDVPKGKVKTVRLRNLPREARIAVILEASGRLAVALIARSELKAKRPRALFSGAFERKLSFTVTIPETADYFLLLDNRRGADEVRATAAIRAQRGPAKPPAPQTPKGGRDERAGLRLAGLPA